MPIRGVENERIKQTKPKTKGNETENETKTKVSQ